MDLIIKQPRVSHIPKINELFYHSIGYWGYSKDELQKIIGLYAITADYLTNYRVYLIYADKQLVGFFSFTQAEHPCI